jgi:photosystem II stability/assembly factor-like uncharacterized protein
MPPSRRRPAPRRAAPPARAAAALLALAAACAGPRLATVLEPPRPVELPVPLWEVDTAGTAAAAGASLRAVRAVSPRVVWASGSRGTVLRTADGGRSWRRLPVGGAGALDFRALWAFDSLTAVVASAGEAAEGQARVYRTADGGRTWALAHQDTARGVFYDAAAFWDREHGLVLSDPVDDGGGRRRFVVLATLDGGRTWQRTPAAGMPDALPGEAAFAAGNAALAVAGTTDAWFVTGGPAGARVFHSATGGARWDVVRAPVAPRSASAGLFAAAFAAPTFGLVAGGDFESPRAGAQQFARTEDGRTWRLTDVNSTAPGYWSGLAHVPGPRSETFVAVGGAGTAVTRDAGRSWTVVDTAARNAVSFAAGGAGWAVGGGGRVVRARGAPR